MSVEVSLNRETCFGQLTKARFRGVESHFSCSRHTDGVAGQREECGPAVRSLRSPHVPASVPGVSLPQGPSRLFAARKRRETQ